MVGSFLGVKWGTQVKCVVVIRVCIFLLIYRYRSCDLRVEIIILSGNYCERSEVKRSELARELPVAVKECTIVGKKTRHNSKTKSFWNMVDIRKNVCF